MMLKIVIVTKKLILLLLLFSWLSGFSQPTKLTIGMRRNTAQTLMGNTKIDFYYRDKTVYIFPDSVLLTIEFDEKELCKGFFWRGNKEEAVKKTMEQNGFTKRDSITYYAKDFPGLLKRNMEASTFEYRFIPAVIEQKLEEKTARKNMFPEKKATKRKLEVEETIPIEKPFYGFTIIGIRVWKAKEKK